MQADRTLDRAGRWFHETEYATLPMTPCPNLQQPNVARKQGAHAVAGVGFATEC